MDLWKAFTPFEPSLWLSLLIALFGTVFLLWLYEGAKNEQFAHGNWGKRRRNMSRVGLGTSFGGERVACGVGGGGGSASRARSAIDIIHSVLDSEIQCVGPRVQHTS